LLSLLVVRNCAAIRSHSLHVSHEPFFRLYVNTLSERWFLRCARFRLHFGPDARVIEVTYRR
jgi:hypothetical protein